MAKESRGRSDVLSMSDRAVLMVLGQFAPINSRTLSERMDINPGTISVYVQKLVSKGLVERLQSIDDRRQWLLHLTDDGEIAYNETIEGAVRYTRKFLNSLEEDEVNTLYTLLSKAAHALGYSWQ